MLSRRSTEINHVLFADVGEDIFYGGEQAMFVSIVMWLYPFSLQYPPKGFGNIEVRGVRREVEYVKASVFPSLKAVLCLSALMDSGVVQDHHSFLADAKREALHKFDEFVGVYVLLGGEAVVNAVAVNHSEDVEPAAFAGGHAEILVFEFPCIRHVSFGAHMAFITVIKVNETRFPLTFKLLQKLLLIGVLLRRGCPFGRLPYTPKSCAREDKKFLKAPSLIRFPVASSHAALALETLWRCCAMAFLTASLSALVLMMRLRPVPGLFFSPSKPSDRNLLTQCITRWCVWPERAPAAALVNPSALPRTIRHRIRNAWHAPFRYPFSKVALCSSVMLILVACLDIFEKIFVCKTITVENGFHCAKLFIRHTYSCTISIFLLY